MTLWPELVTLVLGKGTTRWNQKVPQQQQTLERFWVQWELPRPGPLSLVKPERVEEAECPCGYRAVPLGNHRTLV